MLLAILVALLVGHWPSPSPVAAQDASRYLYGSPLALADAGAWPPERLQAVTIVLDEITVDRGVANWWLSIVSAEDWGPDAALEGPCCGLNLVFEAIYLVDAQGRRYDGSFPAGVYHVTNPGQRGLLIVNFPYLGAESGPLTLRVAAGVGLAAQPDASEEPPSPSARADVDSATLERRHAALAALEPVERATWTLADVRVP